MGACASTTARALHSQHCLAVFFWGVFLEKKLYLITKKSPPPPQEMSFKSLVAATAVTAASAHMCSEFPR